MDEISREIDNIIVEEELGRLETPFSVTSSNSNTTLPHETKSNEQTKDCNEDGVDNDHDDCDLEKPEQLIDLRSISYIAAPDHLNCPICQLPFINPYTTICGHTFCKTCILETLRSPIGNKCPLDRTALNYKLQLDSGRTRDESYYSPQLNDQADGDDESSLNGDNVDEKPNDIFPSPIIISNITDDLKVRCLNEERGCTWFGSRWQIKKHLINDCEYTRFQCDKVKKDGGLCTKLTRRMYMTTEEGEEEECPHTKFDCTKCGENVNKITEAYHLKNECLMNVSKCHGCNLEFPIKLFEKHESFCEKIHLKCPGHKFGCEWKGSRELLNEIHLNECVFTKLAKYFETQESKITEVVNENKYLKTQLSTVLDSVIQGKLTNLGYSLQLEEIMDQNQSNESSNRGMNFRMLNNLQDEDYIHLILEFERLRTDIERLRPLVAESDINKQMVSSLANENVQIKEELNSQRVALNSIRQQIQFMLVDRRRMKSLGHEDTDINSRDSKEDLTANMANRFNNKL
ncbi:hypothetical protein CANARDRAFT_174777 [[Candida] arabinofermentans NRRL YB-2248]|uniref:RING-type domain-containing protein n=1 Tax=[Candida] arabinofermentans NRRL YB-2248 TaxID=983967 RepID=A0A1E4T4Q1_9ASCO|nr:hypothetical protein CANARDRAFT_174777 [[Candida] arabinofermentans NRRL YB-2248]